MELLKKYKNPILLLLVGALTLAVLLQVGDPARILAALKTARLRWIWAAVGVMVLYWALESLVLYLASKLMRPEQRFENTVETAMIGQFFNCITPFASGGQPVQAWHMMRGGMPLGTASSVLLSKFIIYQFVLTLYSLVVLVWRLPFFLSRISGFGLLALAGFGVNTAVVLGLLCIAFFPDGTRRFLHWCVTALGKTPLLKNPEAKRSRIDSEMAAFQEGFALLRRHPAVLLQMSALTVLQLTAFFLIPYFICVSLGVQANLFTVIAAGALVLMISSFVPIPGASGGAEGSFFVFFSVFLGSAGIIALAIIIWRLITFYLPILVGGIFAGRMTRQPKASSLS